MLGKLFYPVPVREVLLARDQKPPSMAESRSMSKVLLQRKILISLTLPAVISWLSHFGLPWQKDS